ncbi:hypothetical protein PHMEG_00010902 [Phytophthora megakarya]|uniref:Uncharacterized protein n=1 Tax=Phytophthora megakarya TaxID=4795 RepID=A0A225WCI6_9STRA|nr:hypothetical protein PHMEG_00010902 [Phytophthora megakarya]
MYNVLTNEAEFATLFHVTKEVSERDPRYKALEDFMLHFVKERGGSRALEIMKSMLANGDIAGV